MTKTYSIRKVLDCLIMLIPTTLRTTLALDVLLLFLYTRFKLTERELDMLEVKMVLLVLRSM